MKQRSRLILIIYTTQPGRHAWPHIHNHSTSHTRIQIHNSGLTSRMNTGQSISSSDIKTIGLLPCSSRPIFKVSVHRLALWLADSVQFAHGGRLLKNDIIACSNWRIKMLLQNMWKKSFKILFLNCFFFPLSCSASSFNPHHPKSLVGEEVARDHMSLMLLVLCVYLILCWQVYVR